MLAQRQRGETDGFRIGRAAADAMGDGGIYRPVGQIGQLARHPRQVKGPGQIAHAQGQRQRQFLAPQTYAKVGHPFARAARMGQRGLSIARGQHRHQIGQTPHRPRQKGRMRLGPRQGALPIGHKNSSLSGHPIGLFAPLFARAVSR